ncbi:Uncharacterised protein [Clostridium disporicum]|uniref:Uncharacterized protein n=1 Tax=Clostridium disporicum TaxID=84024 RepID=A0A174KUA7_9CLOT|nr:Uncharacterised protein [Clostridium disporicum]
MRLTLTRVVFKSLGKDATDVGEARLTLTRVVFK